MPKTKGKTSKVDKRNCARCNKRIKKTGSRYIIENGVMFSKKDTIWKTNESITGKICQNVGNF